MRREIADLIETVKSAKACTLLIGAGCSVGAGIPAAGQFIKVIEKRFPRAYARAAEKTYPYLMAELTPAQRHRLILDHINQAKLNWAHLAIAQLIKHGYVDRVLTVNFDPLVMRACALVGVFPAVYDFAASQNFKPEFIADQSVFYLHGQHTGFVLLNTDSEVRRFSELLEPVFTDSVHGRVWIVAGYSGENDPVFNHLANIEQYDNSLYWVCYEDEPPQKHVQEKLLVEGKNCFCIQGFDADSFFVALAQGLDCFPPDFVQTPFTHLKNLLEPVLPYSLPGSDSSLEAIPKKLLDAAIDEIETPAALVLRARDLLLKGDHASVIAMEKHLKESSTAELKDLVRWGYVSAGNQAAREAQTKSGVEADQLRQQAGEKYEAALKINPEDYQALYNWGAVLGEQAKTKSGEEANRLWVQVGEKCQAALEIRSDLHKAFANWAAALANQALTKSGEEADRLWAQAEDRYATALTISPAQPEYLHYWANLIDNQARTKSGEEADWLWTRARERYEAAFEVKPDDYRLFRDWGVALLRHASTKSGEEADRLWAQAWEKFEAALKIKPDDHDVLDTWSIGLRLQAGTKSGNEAERLLKLADEKLAAAQAVAEKS